jgi:hypothetical protein
VNRFFTLHDGTHSLAWSWASLPGPWFVLAACVPLGGWLYDDPTFVFSELTLRGGGTPDDTLEMVLTACNRNDYPVEARAIEVSLNFAGASLGPAEFSQPFTLQTRDSTKLTVPFPMPRQPKEPTVNSPTS